MTARTVKCRKLGADLPGLAKPPFSGALGQQIFENVSAEAWRLWNDDMLIKLINEYRLDMTNIEHYNKVLEQMRLFLNLDTGDNNAGKVLEVENVETAKRGG